MEEAQFRIVEDKPPTLEEAQEFVGGYVQLETLVNGDQLLMDEDGGWKASLSANIPATLHRRKQRQGAVTVLVGNVLCLRGNARWR